MQQHIKLLWVKSACAHCAAGVQPFNRHRIDSSFDWIPERHRFAFSHD